MSIIVRVVVVCLVVAALPCIAMASDGGDHSGGHDSGGSQGSDHSSGGSSGGGDGGRESSGDTGSHDSDSSSRDSSGSTGSDSGHGSSDGATESGSTGSGTDSPAHSGNGSDASLESAAGSADDSRQHDDAGNSRESRDSGEMSDATDSSPTNHENPGQESKTVARDTDPVREDSLLIETKASERDPLPLMENAGQQDSRRTSSPSPDDGKKSRDDGEKKSWNARDSSEKPDRETRDEASDRDREGTGKTPMTETDGEETLLVYAGVAGTLTADTDLAPVFPGDDGRFASGEFADPDTLTETWAETRHKHTPSLPAPVPPNDIPVAHIPALPASGLPLNSANGNTATSGTPARGKVKGEHEPFWDPSDSALVLSPWMLIKFWCFLGFRRVLKKNVLESEERSSLYESIINHPGVDLSQLTQKLSLNKETARYHLKMLAAHGKISGLIKQGIARYFPCREMISEFEKTVIHYLWIGTTKRILLLLIETPGLTRQAIARELGIAGPSVTWQMQRLAEDGLIEVRNEGRFVRYFLTPGSIDALESVNKSVGQTGSFF